MRSTGHNLLARRTARGLITALMLTALAACGGGGGGDDGTNNTAPVADAGADQTVATGSLVTLDGGASRDANGDALTYAWTLATPAGSAAALSSGSVVSPTFTADVDGIYTATLVVNDGTADSLADQVRVTAAGNRAPNANAGPDQGVGVGVNVLLDGRGSSDPDGDPLTYLWSLNTPPGSAAALSSNVSPTPSFTADVAGAYTATLVVNDGQLDSAPNSTVITATQVVVNTPPVADAGADQTVTVNDTVQLDGSGSADADGDALGYLWTLQKPVGSATALSNPNAVSPVFVPDVAGAYTATLVVNDGQINSAPDAVLIDAASLPGNTPPVADAGPDRTVDVADFVQLDGTGSFDADGDPITFLWSLSRPAGSNAVLSDLTVAMPSFTADVEGVYAATLVVNDGEAASAPDLVQVIAGLGQGNDPPTANAGVDQTVNTGDLVQLDGSGSSDPENDPLTYAWSLVVPAGSNASLSDASVVDPTFTPDVEGSYTAVLVVNDGTQDSAADSINITASTDDPPVADAGADQAVTAGDPVNLDGSGSFDPEGAPLSYAWTLVAPAGSGATLAGANTATPSFTTDVGGNYTATLVVNDGGQDSAPATVVITATVNALPIADAGGNQSVDTGTVVTLDGSASFDPEAQPLTYSWSLTVPPGSGAALSDDTAQSPTFTADLAGTYTATLIVNDGVQDSAPDTATISATDVIGNAPPVADAGVDATVIEGTLVNLSGAGSSDPEGSPLTYSWTLTRPGGSAAVLSDPGSVTPSFTADVPGTYVATLVVNDGTDDSAPDSVTITATVNQPPLAQAGPDQTVDAGDLVQLNGAGSSDPEGQPLTYSWSLTRPAGSSAALSNATAVAPSFTADVDGSYSATLVVNDGNSDSAPDTVIITAETDDPPVADAGPDQDVAAGALVNLDGSASFDPEGQPLTYAWTMASKPGGSNASLAGATTATPSFTADLDGSYTITLVVNDGVFDSAPDSVLVIATSPNTPPVAVAVADATDVNIGTTVNLDGNGSNDVDGDPLSYAWSLSIPAGSAATLTGPTTATPSFVPDVAGTYLATLVVNDGQANSAPDSVSIIANTPPVADAGPDQDRLTGSLINLDGTGSSDADGDPLSYSWSLQRPAGSAAALDDPSSATPSFGADVGGIYTAILTVSDGKADASDLVVIDVNTPPVADAGPDQSGGVGSLVTLDGSGSSDADGDPLGYNWSLQNPPGSSTELSDPTAESPTFTPDVEGDYLATLVVSDGRFDSPPDSVTISVGASGVTVSGRVTFDRVPHQPDGGLDYNNIFPAPARGVLVEAVQQAGPVLDTTVTDADGNYSLFLPSNTLVTVRVRAEMKQDGAPSWDFRVQNNTSGDALYTLDSSVFDTQTTPITLDLNAGSGWDPGFQTYGDVRAAAPFAILDSVYQAVQLVLDAEPLIQMPSLNINWSTFNRTSANFDPANGDIITTAYFYGTGLQEIFVLAEVDVDTDEYDQHVLVHEWGHYLEDRLGRTDSPGGSHTISARLDPRLAFSEGWANAFSAMVLGDPIYKDSLGLTQGSGFTFDVESNTAVNEGWYNESSVHSVLYDIFDASNDGVDAVSLGFGPIFEGMTTWQRDTVATTTIYSLLTDLKAGFPADEGNIEALLQNQSIVGAGMDIWGTNETNNAGNANDVLPIYTPISVGGAELVCSIPTYGTFNGLSTRRFLRLNLGSPGVRTIQVTGPGNSDPDFVVYRQGFLLIAEAVIAGQETLSWPSAPGTYVIEVYEYANIDGVNDFGRTSSQTCLTVTVQ